MALFLLSYSTTQFYTFFSGVLTLLYSTTNLSIQYARDQMVLTVCKGEPRPLASKHTYSLLTTINSPNILLLIIRTETKSYFDSTFNLCLFRTCHWIPNQLSSWTRQHKRNMLMILNRY